MKVICGLKRKSSIALRCEERHGGKIAGRLLLSVTDVHSRLVP